MMSFFFICVMYFWIAYALVRFSSLTYLLPVKLHQFIGYFLKTLFNIFLHIDKIYKK